MALDTSALPPHQLRGYSSERNQKTQMLVFIAAVCIAKTRREMQSVNHVCLALLVGLLMSMPPCHAKEAARATDRTTTASGPAISIGLPDVLGVQVGDTSTKCTDPDVVVRPINARSKC
jgi:hypothetical protein